jgi:hypothetical protein
MMVGSLIFTLEKAKQKDLPFFTANMGYFMRTPASYSFKAYVRGYRATPFNIRYNIAHIYFWL